MPAGGPAGASCVQKSDDSRFCNSHCLSHFAAFFIVMGTKISIVENLVLWLSLVRLLCVIRFVLAAPAALHEASAAAATEGLVELCWISVNDPSAGSPTETLLRLLLPLSDMVYLIFRTATRTAQSKRFTGSLEIGRSDGRCVQRAGT